MEKIKELLKKNIVKYFFCSAISAVLEFVLLLVLKKAFGSYEYGLIAANTISVTVSAILHFIMTSKLVFEVRVSFVSAIIYVVTFLAGLLIQNSVLWVCYNQIFNRIFTNDFILTVSSKCVSLAASFFITYFLRKFLNKKLKEKEQNE